MAVYPTFLHSFIVVYMNYFLYFVETFKGQFFCFKCYNQNFTYNVLRYWDEFGRDVYPTFSGLPLS